MTAKFASMTMPCYEINQWLVNYLFYSIVVHQFSVALPAYAYEMIQNMLEMARKSDFEGVYKQTQATLSAGFSVSLSFS